MVYLVSIATVLGLGHLIPNVASSATSIINTSRNYLNGSELRILNGVAVTSTQEMPWILNLKNMKFLNDCSAALVHVLWALTAGHCVGDRQSISDDILLLAGYVNLAQKSSHGQTRRAIFVARHPKYKSRTISDIAVIKVDKPFQLTPHVSAIPISGDPWHHKEMNNRKCIAAGYGLTSEMQKSNAQLYKKSVIARHGNNACNRDCFSKLMQKEVICLKDVGDICSGDSGGPLVCSGKVVGVAASGYQDDLCKSDGDPTCEKSHGVYIFVCRYLGFLSKHIPNAPRSIKGCRIGGRKRLSGLFGSVGDEDSSWDSASVKSSYIVTIISSQLLFLNYQ